MTTTATMLYSQCGLLIRSEVALDLPESFGDRWDVDVRWGEPIDTVRESHPGETIAEYTAGDTTWYTATETQAAYLLRFRDCGEFVISLDLARVVVRPDRSGRHELLSILLAGTVTAFLAALRGSTVLHASAVAVDGRVLAFVGQSGRGKSTVAALMCLGGAELVTDDVLVVDPGPPVTCLGGSSELRLRAASAHLADAQPHTPTRTTADERLAFAPRPAPAGVLPLAAIVIPSPSRSATEVEFHRLSASDALFAMMSFPRVSGWRRNDVLTREFTTLGQIANQIPVFEVTIPWGPPFDPSVATALATLADPVGFDCTRELSEDS